MNLVTHFAFNERADLSKALVFETEQQIKDFLRDKFFAKGFGLDTLLRTGHFRLMAIQYDFRPWLKKFLIQSELGSLTAAWAPSKGAVRSAHYLSRKDKVFFFPSK